MTTGRSFDDIDAARRWLTEREDCTGRIGVIGCCMGRGYALVPVPDGAFAASSANRTRGLIRKGADGP